MNCVNVVLVVQPTTLLPVKILHACSEISITWSTCYLNISKYLNNLERGYKVTVMWYIYQHTYTLTQRKTHTNRSRKTCSHSQIIKHQKNAAKKSKSKTLSLTYTITVFEKCYEQTNQHIHDVDNSPTNTYAQLFYTNIINSNIFITVNGESHSMNDDW